MNCGGRSKRFSSRPRSRWNPPSPAELFIPLRYSHGRGYSNGRAHGMRIAFMVERMSTALVPASRSVTVTTLSASNWWRRAAWMLAALVATTAAMAHQQIATDDQPSSAPLSDTYLGLVRPRDVSTVALPTAVVVRKVLVAVGDHVRPGQVLLSLDDDEVRKTVEQLTFDVQRAREQTAQIEQSVALLDRSINALTLGVAQANAELAIAQRNAERIPNRQLKDSPERAQVAYDQAV